MKNIISAYLCGLTKVWRYLHRFRFISILRFYRNWKKSKTILIVPKNSNLQRDQNLKMEGSGELAKFEIS